MVACTQWTACSLPASWGSNERYISISKDLKIFCASWTDVSSVENVMAFGSALSPSSLSDRSQPYYLFGDKLPLPITVAPPPRSIGVDDDASLCLLLAQMPNLTTLLPSFSTAINSAVDVVQNTNWRCARRKGRLEGISDLGPKHIGLGIPMDFVNKYCYLKDGFFTSGTIRHRISRLTSGINVIRTELNVESKVISKNQWHFWSRWLSG